MEREHDHGSRLAHTIAEVTQRVGATRIGVLTIGRIVSPIQRELYRRSRGRLSLTGRAPVLLLTTVGRRSGKPRTVPAFFLRDGNRLVICNVNPGFEEPNPWTLNLRANPAARVEVRGRTALVHGRTATDDEVSYYWPLFVDLWPAYETFFDRGGTRTVFVLEADGQST